MGGTKNKLPCFGTPEPCEVFIRGRKNDTVGQRYRRAEIERGEADGIQENGDPEGGSMATIERGEA